MARYDNRQMLRGAVGPMVYYEFMGRQCVRARVTGRNPRTPAQQCGRRVFGLLAHLAGLLRYALRTGLEGEAAVRRTRVQNLFVGMNRPLVEADDNITLDYSRLQLSAGPLAVPQFGEVRRTEESDGKVRLTVTVSPATEGQNGLFVHLCAFAPALEQAVVSLPYTLSGGVAELLLPAAMADTEVYLYAFARSYNGDASPTVCLPLDGEAQVFTPTPLKDVNQTNSRVSRPLLGRGGRKAGVGYTRQEAALAPPRPSGTPPKEGTAANPSTIR